MSSNKARKRLIRKYRKLYNSHPIGLKFSTDGGKTFVAMGNIVEDYTQMLETLILEILTQVNWRLANLVLKALK